MSTPGKSSVSHTKRRTLPALFGSSSGASKEAVATTSGHDRELQRALAMSAKEAQLASMDDEEQMQAAIRASLAEKKAQRHPSPGNNADAKLPPLPPQQQLTQLLGKRKAAEDPNGNDAQIRDPPPPTALALGPDAFDTRNETVITRLEGSLDLIYCKAWLKPSPRRILREWMLSQLAWHRVSYIRPRSTQRIVTPRFTATFGRDDTGAPDSVYTVPPKPLPHVLRQLCDEVASKTSAHYNAVIINYYADGRDSISYHSDDEAFLGQHPNIASLSLGASRDFYLRRKAPTAQAVPAPTPAQKMGTKGTGPAAARPTEKMVLEDGDLLVMRGRTQAEWEHAIPKRTSHIGGRINITLRRVINVAGTNSEFQRLLAIGECSRR